MKKAIYLLNLLSDSNKAIRFFLSIGIFFSLYSLRAQTLNQSAAWPNTSWNVNGVFDATSLISNPTSSSNFSYDDDNAGTGSTDSINAESPTIDLTAANTAGESWIKVEYNYNFNYGDSLQLQYYDAALAQWILWENLPDNSSASSSWCSNLPSTKSSSPALDISTFNATQLSNFKYRFSYNASGVWGYGFCMDAPRLYSLLPITCLPPSTLTSSNESYSSVELGWTEINSATQWQIHYDTAGFPMGTGDSVIAGTNPYTLTNLNGSTVYEFYVRSICSAGDSSTWAGPFSFTTECDPYSPTYSYDFTGYIDECWSEATGRLNFVTTLNYGSSNWQQDGFGNVGTTNAARINIWGTSTDEWLISPSIDLGTGTTDFQVEFDIILTNFGSTASDLMGLDDSLAVVVSTDNGATWSTTDIIKVWVDGNQPLNRRQYVELSLAAYTGVVKIGFYAASTVSNTDYDISIDNFSVDTLSSCPFPTDLVIDNITPTSADLDWTENGTASMWQIEYGTSGFTRGAGTFSILNAKPNSLTNLTPQTDYEIYIRSVCTAGDSSLWHGPVYFTTPCDKFIPEYNFDFTGYIDDCWSEATGRLNTNTAITYGSSNWIQDGFGNVTTTNAARVNISGTSTDEWLISPSIDLGAGTTDFQVEFDIILTNSGSTASDLMGVDDSLAVVVSTDDGTTWSTSNILQTWVDGNQPLNTRQYVELSLAGYTGVVKIGFYAASSISNTDYDISIDNFSVDTLSTCPFPSSLLIDSITATTANIDWTENGSASMWQIEYGSSGFTRGAGTFSILNAKPSSLSNLVPQSDYEIYIRSICGAGDSSLWFGPAIFTTPCDSYVPEYSFDFTGYIDDCWSEATGRLNVNTSLTYGSSNWIEDGFGNVGTTNAAKINIWGTSTDEWLISPSINLGTGATDFQVEFDIILTNYNSTASDLMDYDDSLAVVVSTDNGLSWSTSNIIKTWQAGDQPQNSRQYVELSLAGYTGEVKIGFYAASSVSNTDFDISIDNFSVDTLSTCPFPTSLSSMNPSSNTTDIYWMESGTATSWEIEFDTLGFTLGSGKDSIVNADTVHLSGLNPNTTYQFYVRAICSPGDSSLWAGPFNFTTECGAVSAFPYLENFDGGLRNDVWECWEVLNLDGGSTWSQDNLYITPTHSTPYAAHGMGNNNDHLISPQFNLLNNNMRLKLWDKVESATYNNTYHVLVSTTGKDTSDFTDTLATFNVTNTNWTERIVDLSTYSGQSIYISLYQVFSGSAFWGFGVDDFLVEETPNCVEPLTQYARNISPTTADLSWDSSQTAFEWQVQYGPENFTLGSGIDTVTFWNPTTISGLTPNSAYEYYVRGICGRNDTSVWQGPFYFETPCEFVSTYPYVQPFNTFVPDCWDEADLGDPVNGPSGIGFGAWTSDDFLNNTANGKAAKINLYYNTNREWILSQKFDLSSGGPYELKLQAGMTDWNNALPENMGSDDSVKVLISPNNGITWDVLYTWSLSNQPPNTGAYYIIDLSVYNGGQNTFAIWASDGAVDDIEDYDFFIDNFEVREIPTCREPSSLSLLAVTDSSANISWVENNSATSWEVRYGTSGFTFGNGFDTIVNSNPFLLTGLNGNTAYEYYVRSICAAADSSLWSGPFQFETPCGALSAPYYADFENSGSIPNCWSQGSSNMENWIFATTGGHVGNAGTFSASRKSNGYFAYVDDSTPDNTGTTLETPFIDLGSMKNPALSFYLISNNEGNSNVDFNVEVWDGSSWNNVYISNSNTINGDWQEVIIELNNLNITGPIRARFVVDETIANDFYDDIAIDDIYIYDMPEIDASIVEILSPNTACGLSATENVQIAVLNQGMNLISSIDLSYSIDGQTAITEQYTDTIFAGDTLFYTFDSTADLSQIGSHLINAYISLLNDTLPNNDSINVEVINIPLISTYPYSQSFENGNEGWVSGGSLSSWELGQPANSIIDTAYHGTNAWVTSLSGTYNNNEDSYVLSPCFDFTNMLVPQISMHIWWNSEFSWDGANLQYSLDDGLTWNNVGLFGDPENWYNDNSINGAPGGTQEGWTGRNSSSNGSAGWLRAMNSLSSLAGEPSVRLRINFGSDGSAVDEGFAFDNIIIRETPATDAIASILLSPTNGCGLSNADTVKFMIINNGVQGIYNFDLGYTLDTNSTVIETYTDTLNAGDTMIYTFQAPADFSDYRDYNVMTYVNLINDMDSTNDTSYSIVTSIPTISGFPYFESFEKSNGGWTSAGDLSSWELGSPANAIINSAANGNKAWVTSLSGTYNNGEDSYVISPCMDFTNLLAPEIRMAVWWNSEFSWDGANLQYSIDNGLSWNNVGAFGDPNNWYTDNSISGAPGGTQEGWSGRISSSNGSNGWLIASNDLSSLAGEPSVRLRVNFGSDGSINDEGFAFDDIIIGDPISLDARVLKLIDGRIDYCLGNFNPMISIENLGSSTLNSVKIVSDINGALDTIVYTSTMNTNQIDTISLPNYNLVPGLNNVKFYTLEPNGSADQLSANDSLGLIIDLMDITAGTISGTDSICGTENVNLALIGTIGNVQWQRLVGNTFVDEASAVGEKYQVLVDSTTSFRAIVCGTAVSDTFTVFSNIVTPPTVVNDTAFILCGDSGTVNLSVSSANSNHIFNWYEDASSNTKIHTGNSYIYGVNTNRQPITTNHADTFYVTAIEGSGGSVDTLTIEPFTGTNGCTNGNMFDVIPLTNVSIEGFTINSNTIGSQTVNVYMKQGSYLGSQTTAANWTLVESVSVSGNGGGTASILSLSNSIDINSGDTVGIYIDYNAAYTNVNTGTVYSNSDLQVVVGDGLCTSFGGVNAGRAFNGQILYTTGCESVRVPIIGNVQCEAMTDLAIFEFVQPISSGECYSTTEDLEIKIWNAGGKSIDFTVDTLNISVTISGEISQLFTLQLNNNSLNNGFPLEFEDSILVNMGSFDMSSSGIYNFEAIIQMDNDLFAANDSLRTSVSNNTSAGSITVVDSICGSDFVTMNTSGSVGDLQWQRMVSGIFSDEIGADSSSYEVFVDSTTTFRLLACGTEVSDTFTVVSIEIPLAPTTSNDSVSIMCGISGEAILTASAGSSSKFNWYDAATGGTLVATGDSLIHNFSSSTQSPAQHYADTFYVAEISMGCEGPRAMAIADITIMTPDAPTTVSDTAIVFCGDTGTAVLSAYSPISGSSFQWYADSNGSNLLSSTDTLLYVLATTAQPVTTEYTDTFYVHTIDPVTNCESPMSMVIGTVFCTVGNEEMKQQLDMISIMPNPSKGIFHLLGSNVEDEMLVSILNMNGQIVYELDNKLSKHFDQGVDISHLNKGVYFVKFQGKNTMEIRKVIIQ